MNRTLAAAALAAALLPAASFQAAAAPATLLAKTYALQCQVNANDGTALKIRIMVKNTTGRIIKKGTPITLRYVYRYVPGARVQHVRSQTQIAYRDVLVNDSIGLDQPRRALRCMASVKLRPDVQTKIKTTR